MSFISVVPIPVIVIVSRVGAFIFICKVHIAVLNIAASSRYSLTSEDSC